MVNLKIYALSVFRQLFLRCSYQFFAALRYSEPPNAPLSFRGLSFWLLVLDTLDVVPIHIANQCEIILLTAFFQRHVLADHEHRITVCHGRSQKSCRWKQGESLRETTVGSRFFCARYHGVSELAVDLITQKRKKEARVKLSGRGGGGWGWGYSLIDWPHGKQ